MNLSRLHFRSLDTVNRVAICPKGNGLNVWIYAIHPTKIQSKGIIAMKLLLYTWIYSITGDYISGFYCIVLIINCVTSTVSSLHHFYCLVKQSYLIQFSENIFQNLLLTFLTAPTPQPKWNSHNLSNPLKPPPHRKLPKIRNTGHAPELKLKFAQNKMLKIKCPKLNISNIIKRANAPKLAPTPH